ncbi:hypothetical protein ACJX0J_018676, partial [Zea mays]
MASLNNVDRVLKDFVELFPRLIHSFHIPCFSGSTRDLLGLHKLLYMLVGGSIDCLGHVKKAIFNMRTIWNQALSLPYLHKLYMWVDALHGEALRLRFLRVRVGSALTQGLGL